MGYSFLRGIRFPNLWSYTHYLFNYEYGFMKRGLIGEVISTVGGPAAMTYEVFWVLSSLVYVANMLLLFWLGRALIRTEQPLLAGAALVFAGSLAIVYLSHTIGYFDHIGLFVTLVALQLRRFYVRLAFLSFAMPIVLLTHEAMLVLFFPVLFMSLLLSIDTKRRMPQFAMLGGFAAGVLALALVVGNYTLTQETAERMYADLQTEVEVPLRKDAFEVLYRTADENTAMMQVIWAEEPVTLRFAAAVPLGLALLVFLGPMVALLRHAKQPWWVLVLAVLGALSPLLLHAIAWDAHRWNTLAVTTSFLMLYIAFATFLPTQPPRALHVPRSWCIAVLGLTLVLNLTATIPLHNYYEVRSYPFGEHVIYFKELVRGTRSFPSIPIR